MLWPHVVVVQHPEGREEVAAEGAVQAVLVVLGEEFQVAVHAAFGVHGGALHVVPEVVVLLIDVAPGEAVDPDARELSVDTPGCPSLRLRKAASSKDER